MLVVNFYIQVSKHNINVHSQSPLIHQVSYNSDPTSTIVLSLSAEYVCFNYGNTLVKFFVYCKLG